MAGREQGPQEMDTLKEHFSGKSVVITGAASGIGNAMAQRLNGIAELELVDIKPIPTPSSRTTRRYYADVTDPNLMRGISSSVSNIDVLILSAGITQSKPGEVTDEEKRKIMETNAGGVRNTFESLKGNLKKGSKVVFLSSDTISDPSSSLPAYKESKLEIARYAAEVAKTRPDLEILVFLPGPVMTDLFKTGKDQDTTQRIDTAVGIMEPFEFANIALKIISKDSHRSSGPFIRVYKNQGVRLLTSTEKYLILQKNPY